jgi:hypothetical protein
MDIQSRSAQSTETPMHRDIFIPSRPTIPVTEADVTTPIGASPVGSQYTRSPTRSRRSTPIIEPNLISPTSAQRTRRFETEFSTFDKRRTSSTDDRAPPLSNNIEAMLVKQGKQIRALYELQKTTFDKISTIQSQMKKLTSKNTELSPKVFNVSNHNLV